MRKILSITLALILSMSLFTACSSKENEAKEAIVGDWKMSTYYELTDDGEKDKTLTKYFKEDGVMTFNPDGSMNFANGYENEWQFLNYDKENNVYVFGVGDTIKFYMSPDDTSELIRANEFSGGDSTNDAGSRSMTLEALNNLDNLYRDKKDIPDEGTQIWVFEKS